MTEEKKNGRKTREAELVPEIKEFQERINSLEMIISATALVFNISRSFSDGIVSRIGNGVREKKIWYEGIIIPKEAFDLYQSSFLDRSLDIE